MAPMSAPDRSPPPPIPTIEAATFADVPAIAEVFARAFGEYRLALGCDTAALARLWAPLIAARLSNWHVARISRPCSPEARPVVGILSLEAHGEAHGSAGHGLRTLAVWRRELGIRGLLWACYALFPLAIAYVRRPPRSDELYVANLAVAPAYQNRGIGRRLLATAAQRAQERGYRWLSLHVAAANAPALHLYESAGFSPEVTIRPPYRGPLGIPAFIAMRSGQLSATSRQPSAVSP